MAQVGDVRWKRLAFAWMRPGPPCEIALDAAAQAAHAPGPRFLPPWDVVLHFQQVDCWEFYYEVSGCLLAAAE